MVSENGYLRWYVASMGIGAVVVLALLILATLATVIASQAVISGVFSLTSESLYSFPIASYL